MWDDVVLHGIGDVSEKQPNGENKNSESVSRLSMREMDERKTIIMLASIRFQEDLWQRHQQLAKQFYQMGYRVIFLNHQSTIP